jgi:hypothetical protein
LSTDQLPEITDEQMNTRLAQAREYTLLILTATPKTSAVESAPIIWEHGRRNMALRDDGVLSIVCPVTDGSEVAGIGIFNASADEVSHIMQGDPAVESGVLTYEVHPVRGFPGDSLPE